MVSPLRSVHDHFTVRIGRVVDRLHHFGGDDDGVDVGRKLFAGLDAVHERVDLVFKVVVHLKDRLVFHQGAVLGGVDGEILAVLQADPRLVAHEIDIHLILPDILRPSAVQGDNRAGGADEGGDGVVHVIGAAVIRGTRPHVGIGIVLHIFAEAAEGLAADPLNLLYPVLPHQ